jgi:hypothetical protein
MKRRLNGEAEEAEPLEVACAERWWEEWLGEARVRKRVPQWALPPAQPEPL